jgi:hypothetical protein
MQHTADDHPALVADPSGLPGKGQPDHFPTLQRAIEDHARAGATEVGERALENRPTA